METNQIEVNYGQSRYPIQKPKPERPSGPRMRQHLAEDTRLQRYSEDVLIAMMKIIDD